MEEGLEELWSLVSSVPHGKVASYGQIGAALTHPVSGYQIGRWMAQAPPDLPWWRIVGKDGQMRTAKRDPRLAAEQEGTLRKEGITLVDGRVQMERHRVQLG